MEGKQKALFIGRITAINTDTYSIIPSTIMITRLMTYGYLNVHLRVFMSEADFI